MNLINNPTFHIIVAIILFILSISYRKGLFHTHKDSRLREILDIDYMVFGDIANKKITLIADKASAYVCLIFSMLIIINLVLLLTFNIRNINNILIIIFIIVSWPTRYLIIYLLLNNKIKLK